MIELFCKALLLSLLCSSLLSPYYLCLLCWYFYSLYKAINFFPVVYPKFFCPLSIIQFQSPFIFLAFVIAASNSWYQNVYYFPESAVTNYCKLGGLEQWNLLSNSFGNQKSKISFTEPKSRSCKGHIAPLALTIHSLPLQASGSCWHFLIYGCIITPASASIIILPVSVCLISPFIPLRRLHFT